MSYSKRINVNSIAHHKSLHRHYSKCDDVICDGVAFKYSPGDGQISFSKFSGYQIRLNVSAFVFLRLPSLPIHFCNCKGVSGTNTCIHYIILLAYNEFDWARPSGLSWFCVNVCNYTFVLHLLDLLPRYKTNKKFLTEVPEGSTIPVPEVIPGLVLYRPDSMLFRQPRSEQVPWPKTHVATLWVRTKVRARSSVCWPSERTWQTTGTTLGQEHYLLYSQRHAAPCVLRWPRMVITSRRSLSWVLRWWNHQVTPIWIFQCGSLVLLRRPSPGSRAGTLSLSCARGQSL